MNTSTNEIKASILKKCTKCESHAFNFHRLNIDQGSLCDAHYRQDKVDQVRNACKEDRKISCKLEQPGQELAKTFNDGVLEGMLRERAYWLKDAPMAGLRCKIIENCKSCQHSVGRVSCSLGGRNFDSLERSSTPPEWCPLPIYIPPQPAAQQGPLTATDLAIAEVTKATIKFPTWPTDPLHALAVLGEEFGELTKATLQLTYEPTRVTVDEWRNEAIQTAAMALRFLISLEASAYEFKGCEQHQQANHRIKDGL